VIKRVKGNARVNERLLRKKITGARESIVGCYNKQVRAGNLTKGMIQLDFMLWTDGCAAEIATKTPTKGLIPTASCLKGVFQGVCVGEIDSVVNYRTSLLFEPVPNKSRSRR